jgi:hypothetical protein
MLPFRIAGRLRRQLNDLRRQFLTLSGGSAAAKRTIYFDSVVAAPQGDMDMLIINAPFTDAHVTYYEANGVSN